MIHEDAFRWLSEQAGISEPRVNALGLVLLSLAAAWLARRLILRHALPFARRTSTDMDEYVLRAIATPVALSLVFWGVVVALRSLAEDPATLVLLDRVLPTGLLVIWGAAVSGIAAQALLRSAKRVPGQSAAKGALLLGRLMRIVVGIVILLTLFSLWGVSVTPLLASAGIVGIALALAAQDTLANLFAGVAVYADGLYEVGDYVVLDHGSETEIRGEIRDIGLRSTRILTRDDVLVIVPNSLIANARVVNETGQVNQYRIHVGVQVAYESDLEEVERVLVSCAEGHPQVLSEPTPRARVRRFADSGIACELLAWIADPRDRGPVVHDLSKRIHATFRERGIRIPFPQRDVHHFEGRREA